MITTDDIYGSDWVRQNAKHFTYIISFNLPDNPALRPMDKESEA